MLFAATGPQLPSISASKVASESARVLTAQSAYRVSISAAMVTMPAGVGCLTVRSARMSVPQMLGNVGPFTLPGSVVGAGVLVTNRGDQTVTLDRSRSLPAAAE